MTAFTDNVIADVTSQLKINFAGSQWQVTPDFKKNKFIVKGKLASTITKQDKIQLNKIMKDNMTKHDTDFSIYIY